jgi:hypothetical protein
LGEGDQNSGISKPGPRGYLARISAKFRNFFWSCRRHLQEQQFRILLIAKAIAIINRNHVLTRLRPPLRRMRFSEATR